MDKAWLQRAEMIVRKRLPEVRRVLNGTGSLHREYIDRDIVQLRAGEVFVFNGLSYFKFDNNYRATDGDRNHVAYVYNVAAGRVEELVWRPGK